MPKPTRYHKVPVTQEQIDLAVPKDSSHCMIADALKEKMPEARRVSVDLATIRYTLGGIRYIHLTPSSCQVALLRFDHGEKVEPFTFSMQAPVQTHQSGHKSKRTDNKATTKRVNTSSIVQKRGGNAPPLAPLANRSSSGVRSGRIRQFGIRGMG
jgi:hypothetical protein